MIIQMQQTPNDWVLTLVNGNTREGLGLVGAHFSSWRVKKASGQIGGRGGDTPSFGLWFKTGSERSDRWAGPDGGRKQSGSLSSRRNGELCTDTRLGCHYTGAYLLTTIFSRSHTMWSSTNKPLWAIELDCIPSEVLHLTEREQVLQWPRL